MERSDFETACIKQAQQGEQEAMEQLAALAKARLCAYLYRISLDYDLAEDLTQESLLEMVKSINDLKEPNRFWGWLYRIALNKFHTHYRREKIRQNIEQSFMEQLTRRNKALQGEQGLSKVIQSELSKAVISAIHELEPRQRAVLSLRCFDQLEYAHIAEAMETTELNARIMFFRAKQSLKKELVRQGLSKGSLLIALGFFGTLTETSEAAAAAGATAVTVSTAKVSLMTAVLATCGVKMTCLLAGAAALITVFASAAGVYHAVDIHYNGLPKRSDVVSVHFTMQSQSNSPGTPASFSKGAYEQWYLFPEGVEGAVFLRVQRWNPTQTEKQCTWLQNGDGNYYYHSGDKTLYLQNYRTWSRSLTQIRVRRLPVDEPEMTAFLDRIEEPQGEISYQQDKRTGMLKEAVDYRVVEARGFKTVYEYNQSEDRLFENEWTNLPVVDERDAMRKRGWAYFQIDGELDGKPLKGYGCIPFVYNVSKERPPWMVLEVDNELKIVDLNNSAAVMDAGGREMGRYRGHCFFAGLLRPWMGMHTIDIIRRDAARQQVAFETRQLSSFHKTGSDEDYYADAKVLCKQPLDDGAEATLEYLVDMDEDLLKYLTVEIKEGKLRMHRLTMSFTYLQDITQAPAEMIEPEGLPAKSSVLPDQGMRWLIDLAQHRLGFE